jgi:hypothetical protein
MPLRLVSEDIPGKAYWRCTDCGWESSEFPKREQRSTPSHHCKQSEEIHFDPEKDG